MTEIDGFENYFVNEEETFQEIVSNTPPHTKSACEECDRQAEIIAIGMQAPLYVCEKCGKDVKV